MSRACAIDWPQAIRRSDEFSACGSHHAAHVSLTNPMFARWRDRYARDSQMSTPRPGQIGNSDDEILGQVRRHFNDDRARTSNDA